jgi:hypothetical protein
MQDLLQTPFDGYKAKDELISSIKYFIEKYESEYLGLIYTEINIQNYLGFSITKKIIEKVRSKYPKVEEEDIWKAQKENLDYSNFLSDKELNEIVNESSNE